MIGFATLSFVSYREALRLQNDVDQSFQIENVGYNKENAATELLPQVRDSAFKALATKNGGARQHFQKVEQEFRRFALKKIEYLHQKTIFYSSLCGLMMILSIVVSWLYLHLTLFSPIRLLSRRMNDFLTHKYSYRFSQPKKNEVGTLHATFHIMAQRVLHTMDELKNLDHAKSEFLNIASHELRTPLTSIKGSLSLLHSGILGSLNEASQQLVTIAQTETDRLIRLINDFLDLAKIEAGQLPIQKKYENVIEFLNSNALSLQGFAQAADVELEVLAQPLEVLIDKDRIQQVLTNLVSNAIKFSPAKSKIQIVCLINEHNLVQIEVKDQGKGIAPEDQELIFQKFRQATNSSQPLVKGTGLGLAIAKALVDEHKGQIGVRSTVGQGSSFYFTLPEWRHILNRTA